MSMDFERNREQKPITEQEGLMFAATPVWERNRKRKGFGRKTAPAATAAPSVVAPEPRSFAGERYDDEPMALDTPIHDRSDAAERTVGYERVSTDYDPAAAPYRTNRASEDSDAGLVAPIGRPAARTERRATSKGMGPVALAAGVVTLGAIGAVGWYASQPGEGVPEMAPGGATTSEMAAAPLPPMDLPPSAPVADTAVNPPLAAAAPPPRQTVRAPVRTAEARTRPAEAAPSAADASVNTSTTLPAGPQPYSTLNPGATPPPVIAPSTATVTPPVTEAAPAPAEAPAAIPDTPPTLPNQVTPPADPVTEATPPTS